MSVSQNNSTLECVGVISEPRALKRVRFRTNPGELDLLSESCASGFRPALVQDHVTVKSVGARLLHVRVVVVACSGPGISQAASFLHPGLLGQTGE